MTDHQPLKIHYYTDILCVWAYCAQARVDELRKNFGAEISFDYFYIPVFGSTAQKIGAGWSARGGFEGYNQHVQEVAKRFPHIEIHPELWAKTRPASSSSPHLFLKAVQLLEGSSEQLVQSAWALRLAFFRDARDVALRSVQLELAESLGLPIAALEALLSNGRALAALFEDTEAQQRHKIEGSPTFLFNEGRQKLYGNLGYRVIEANLQELLRTADQAQASWC